MQTIDRFGDHAACCSRKEGTACVTIASATWWSGFAILEKKGILGPTSGRRPGDVTVPLWKKGHRRGDHEPLQRGEALRSVRAQRKHGKYDRSFRGTNDAGDGDDWGQSILRQVFHFAAKRQNAQLCVYVDERGLVFPATSRTRCPRPS